MKNILIHCAMNKEADQIASKLELIKVNDNLYKKENKTLIITGIGKQKTAIGITKYLENNPKPDLIINIGYAGANNQKIGEWVSISKVYNFEWNILDEEKYSMDVGNQELLTLSKLKTLPCYSAECFVTSTDIKEDVVFDMELHSLAIICDMYNIKLASLKKVSDNLNIKDYYSNLECENVFELVSSVELIKDIENIL